MDISLNSYWNLLHVYLLPQWRQVLLLLILLLSSTGLQVLNPQLIRRFIDIATTGGTLDRLTVLAIAFLVFTLLIQMLGIAATYFGEKIGWIASNNLRADLALHCLRLDMSFHNERTPGEMIERIDGDLADLGIFFSQFVVRIFGNLLLLVGVLAALFIEDWRIGLVLTIYAIITLYLLNRMRGSAVPYWNAAREASADLYGYLEEQISGREDIRSSGAVDYTMHNLYKFDRERLQRERKASLMNTRVFQLILGLTSLETTIALIGGFYLFTHNLITIGTVYLIVNYTAAMFAPLNEITRELQNLQKAGGSAARVEDLYRIKSKIEDRGTENLPSAPLAVAFDNVSFNYNGEDQILNCVSFQLEPGKVLGILGRTGSGKTTVVRLLFRLYDVSDGTVRLNGIDVRNLKLTELQCRVGMVTQDVQLFRATVRDNLTFFDKGLSDERIMQVLEELHLMDWYATLANGLDTEFDSGGKGLSAGEGQLLALARIFLKNPGLVILDEASSRLDPATERHIERAMDKLLENRTGIIIAHRLATIQRADKIIILENGSIIEQGEYVALSNNSDSRLASLLRTGLEDILA